ncbi:MAG: hypothetical protein LBO74_09620 [Candidatus Symbiothrix sp.]|nr:hypothetical protein [Candidatus Symbiothrix sp.]
MESMVMPGVTIGEDAI